LTYNQARLNGRSIKAGAKGITVKYEDRIEIEKRKGDQIVKETVPYVRLHTVFNIEQTEPTKVD
jgi:antirestriction protein ArdC